MRAGYYYIERGKRLKTTENDRKRPKIAVLTT